MIYYQHLPIDIHTMSIGHSAFLYYCIHFLTFSGKQFDFSFKSYFSQYIPTNYLMVWKIYAIQEQQIQPITNPSAKAGILWPKPVFCSEEFCILLSPHWNVLPTVKGAAIELKDECWTITFFARKIVFHECLSILELMHECSAFVNG